MVGMHGTYEANHRDARVRRDGRVGARFDDRVTGQVSAFSPGSKKIHIDIDPSSINKNVRVDLPVVGDAARRCEAMLEGWQGQALQAPPSRTQMVEADRGMAGARFLALSSAAETEIIKPQYALERLYALTQDRDIYITTEVGQHQMWAAQFLKFEERNRWMTSGGLGTMGYGLPAAVGVQIAHPDALVIDVAGEASILMNIQEMSTVAQYRLPVKVFIINNQ